MLEPKESSNTAGGAAAGKEGPAGRARDFESSHGRWSPKLFRVMGSNRDRDQPECSASVGVGSNEFQWLSRLRAFRMWKTLGSALGCIMTQPGSSNAVGRGGRGIDNRGQQKRVSKRAVMCLRLAVFHANLCKVINNWCKVWGIWGIWGTWVFQRVCWSKRPFFFFFFWDFKVLAGVFKANCG